MIEKDYREYIENQSVEGLQKVIQHINKDKYPEHYDFVLSKLSDKIKDDINFKKNENSVPPNQLENHSEKLIPLERKKEDAFKDSYSKNTKSTEENNYKKIMYGWITGLILAAYILVVNISSLINASPEEDLLRIYLGFVDVFVTLLLTYGFYKKNKTSAIILLLYYAIPRVIIFLNTNDFVQFLKGLVFIYFLIQGTMAIFEYHRTQKSNVNSQDAL